MKKSEQLSRQALTWLKIFEIVCGIEIVYAILVASGYAHYSIEFWFFIHVFYAIFVTTLFLILHTRINRSVN